MIDRLVSQLELSVNKSVDFIHFVSNQNAIGQPISYSTRRDINEALESLYILSSTNIVQPIDDTIIRGVFRLGQDVIFEKLLHFGNYYYSKQKIIHGDIHEREEILRRTNVETASMLSRIRAFQLSIDNMGGSTDDYFVDRMPQLLSGISFVINKKVSEIYIPVFYNLLNLHKTIYFYYKSNHTKYLSKIENLHNRVVNLITQFSELSEFSNIIETNESVRSFYEQYLHFEGILKNETIGGKNITFELDINHLRLQQKLRMLSNLSVQNRELFIKYFEETFSEIERVKNAKIVDNAIIITIISIYIKLKYSDVLIDLNIKSGVEKVQLSEHLNQVFNGLDKINEVSVSEDEIKLLYGYDDAELRERVANTIINVPAYELEREMKKPHGVFEISDMEIRIRIKQKVVYLCIPFKTGKEIKSDSVAVDVLYQLLRPYFHFNNCAVLFITAKKCSQNLLNEIKRAHDKYGFSIEVLENQQLAKLLKLNRQLN